MLGPSWGAELQDEPAQSPGNGERDIVQEREDVVESLQNTDKHEHK